jgi:hypothetical protein
VFTVARGSSAAVADPYEPPEAPAGTGPAWGTESGFVTAVSAAVGVSPAITVSVIDRTAVSPFAVINPVVSPVLATVATLVGDVDQTTGTLGIGVPLTSRTIPETWVVSPTFNVVALAEIWTMWTGADGLEVFAVSDAAPAPSPIPIVTLAVMPSL